jgi:hypothetical protein
MIGLETSRGLLELSCGDNTAVGEGNEGSGGVGSRWETIILVTKALFQVLLLLIVCLSNVLQLL